ncbi:MAG: TetR/AcrR family transcriptional regulator [Pseudomonadales bacterium]
MPRAFDERERTAIRARLVAAGSELFRAGGVAKTTVDDLARSAGIAKGSFYKFYSSKELLFFEILDQVHEALRAPLLQPAAGSRDRKAFEWRLRTLFEASYREPLIRRMGQQDDFQAVVRRVPADRLEAHQSRDQAFIDDLIARWADPRRPPARDVVAAQITSTLLLCLRRDFLGERLYPLAFDAAIDSLIACFFPDPDPQSHAGLQ